MRILQRLAALADFLLGAYAGIVGAGITAVLFEGAFKALVYFLLVIGCILFIWRNGPHACRWGWKEKYMILLAYGMQIAGMLLLVLFVDSPTLLLLTCLPFLLAVIGMLISQSLWRSVERRRSIETSASAL